MPHSPTSGSPPPRPIRFAIEASRCRLRPGDRVIPETEVGPDPDSGEVRLAGCHGVVAGIAFRGAEHVLELAIQPDPA